MKLTQRNGIRDGENENIDDQKFSFSGFRERSLAKAQRASTGTFMITNVLMK